MPAPHDDRGVPEEHRWRSHPVLSLAIRAAAILVPAACGAVVALVVAHNVARPEWPGIVAWWFGLVALSWVTALLVERVMRRFLPLAVLMQLSLVFPDRAPSRYKLARGNGNVRVLQERVRRAREEGIDDDPARAAEQILELVAALSAHDRRTRGHSERVRAFADLIAGELALPQDDRDRLRWASLLHDIGKLRISPRILNKPGKPEQHEWESLKRHPEEGARLAAPLMGWLGAWAAAIEHHHERFDGEGYPNGLAGEEISYAGRIVSVADSFEVMTAARSYKKPKSVPAARKELAACAGSQFDPAIVRPFLNVSIGRLWWTVGPASWIAITPFLGSIERAAEQVVIAAKSGAVVVALGAGGALHTTVAAASEPDGSADRHAAEAQPGGGEPSPTPSAGGGGGTPGSDDGGSQSDGHGGGSGSGGSDDGDRPRPSPSPSTSPKPSPSPSTSPGPSPSPTIRPTVSPKPDPVATASDAVDEVRRTLGTS